MSAGGKRHSPYMFHLYGRAVFDAGTCGRLFLARYSDQDGVGEVSICLDYQVWQHAYEDEYNRHEPERR